jgi:dihydrofolate reductase
MINAIFASDSYGGIGFRGTLPWPHNPEDLDHFKRITTNHIVVMGRNTWDDPKMPKPLPNRINIVVTSKPIPMPGVITISGTNIEERLKKIQEEFPTKDIFIIGGKKLLESTRPIIRQIYLTRMKGSYNIDTKLDLRRFLLGYQTITCKPGTNCTYEVLQDILR